MRRATPPTERGRPPRPHPGRPRAEAWDRSAQARPRTPTARPVSAQPSHDFSKNRPRFATFSAPKRTNIRLFAPSEPRGGAAKRRRKAPTGVVGGQLAAKTTRAAAPCEGKSLTNPNRLTAQKRQQRPKTPPTALKAPRALVIIFWKKPPPPRRRPRPIRTVRGAGNGVSTRRTSTLVATIPPREVDSQQHEWPRRGRAISNRGWSEAEPAVRTRITKAASKRRLCPKPQRAYRPLRGRLHHHRIHLGFRYAPPEATHSPTSSRPSPSLFFSSHRRGNPPRRDDIYGVSPARGAAPP